MPQLRTELDHNFKTLSTTLPWFFAQAAGLLKKSPTVSQEVLQADGQDQEDSGQDSASGPELPPSSDSSWTSEGRRRFSSLSWLKISVTLTSLRPPYSLERS
jgi:hypothetical protein